MGIERILGSERQRRSRYLSAVGLLACVFAACGGSDESSHADDADQRVSDLELQSLLESANEFTREIIEDGLVTAEEYERAVLRTMQCMDEAGVEHTEPVFKEYRFNSRWEYSVVGGIGSAADDAYTECYDEFERSVVVVWNAQEEMTEAEKQLADEEFLQCVQEGGIDVATRAELNSLSESGTMTDEQRFTNTRCFVLVYEGWDLGLLE